MHFLAKKSFFPVFPFKKVISFLPVFPFNSIFYLNTNKCIFSQNKQRGFDDNGKGIEGPLLSG